MVKIYLETYIDAPIQRVFDLSRSIDAHIDAAGKTKEVPIGGVTSGLINLNETVTWSAVHFSVKQKLTVKIVEFESPHLFADQMIKGAFKSMYHKHKFLEHQEGTLMKDYFEFEAPLGFLGTIVEKLILKKYMTKFLLIRNEKLKSLAESDEWKEYLPN